MEGLPQEKITTLADPQPFTSVKLICGIMASNDSIIHKAEESLLQLYGDIDSSSPLFPFDLTDYYEKQMGGNLKRIFLSFEKLIEPERLSAIKQETIRLERKIREESQAALRIANLDPGYLTPSSLIMATAKDFAHRVPLKEGIYAHLEFLFGKDEIRTLDWTYPDYKSKGYQEYFLGVRRIYLSQLRKEPTK